MDRIEKFFRKLDTKLFLRVRSAASAITRNELNGLDIKPLRGGKNWFRCRVGNVRLIFTRTGAGVNILIDAEFRGRAYRRL